MQFLICAGSLSDGLEYFGRICTLDEANNFSGAQGPVVSKRSGQRSHGALVRADIDTQDDGLVAKRTQTSK